MTPDFSEALDRIFNGYSILFLGSGFSAYAQNKDSETLPTGSKLLSLLKDGTKISSDYPLDILAREHLTSSLLKTSRRKAWPPFARS